jgi:hypothetical protein
MSEILPNPEPQTSLYGEDKPEISQVEKPQGVLDQFVGIFTEPVAVFRRLRIAPSWVGALVLTILVALFATLTWAAKVDMEAAAKRQIDVVERFFPMPPAEVDKALEKAATQGKPFVSSSLNVVLGVPFVLLIMSGILFAFSRFGGEAEDVTFKHAWAATTVHGLAMVPISLLAGIMCLLRNVGGAPSFASLAPTTLAFWIQPENPWLRGLLAVVDPFYFFSFVALYLAARYTMRLKTWATVLLMAIMGFFGFLFHFLGGIF